MCLSVIRPLDFSPHIQIPGSATVTLSPGGAMLLANLLPPARCPLASPLRCQAPAHHHQPAVSRGLLLRGAGSPVVKRLPAGDWLLWYHSGARVALATSPDGLRWSPPMAPDPLLPSTDWWVFDTAAVRPGDVLVISGPDAPSSRRLPPSSSSAVYWLYYTGSNDARLASSPFPAADVAALPGLAISQDGRHWARIEGGHHTGALLGVGEDHPQGWEKRCAAAPKVVMHADGDLRMYYHSFDEMSQRHAVGVARSRDGIRWERVGKALEGGGPGSFDEGGVRQGHVVRDRAAGRYMMAYEGLDGNGGVSIGLAVSEDGLRGWRRCSESPALRPSEDDDEWDVAGVGAPCLVQMDGPYDWRLYYMGVGKDGEAAIGMAYSEGQGLPRFNRCDALLM
ncbi:unnamed protein product [Triticum turgidum subsp. durum]|uniref:Uncharacterized protein n=1 Tax=Triticum turgidum subsp. durum TaxID=4567 RepID=A0A9R1P8J8_TRITD|nr:unnamed protein product [Triticum turgidum subsp. durum]